MWSKTATSACSNSIKASLAALACALLVSSASADMAPGAQLVALGERIHQELISQGYLQDNQITWSGSTFDVSSRYQLCPGYNGICYKAIEVGFDDPIVLAAYEIGPGQVDILQVDYLKYKKDRSNSAKQLLEAGGRSEKQVYRLTDASGAALFDSWGQLTKAGDAYYESALNGATPQSGSAARSKGRSGYAGVAQGGGSGGRRVGQGDDRHSRMTVNELLRQGYRQINEKELDCLHRASFDDKELILEKVYNGKGRRLFLYMKDPAWTLVYQYRKEGRCRVARRGTFGE